jgi:predicted nucleic acid-binding Zn ribbon protein
MKNNKLFSILLALLVCLSMVVSASATENELSFTLESDSSVEALDAAVVNVGETVTVLVNIESNPGIIELEIRAKYDSNVLTFQKATLGSIFDLDGKDVKSKALETNKGVIQAWVLVPEALKSSENGVFVTLEFKVNDSFDGNIDADKFNFYYASYATSSSSYDEDNVLATPAVHAHHYGEGTSVAGDCTNSAATVYECTKEGCNEKLSVPNGVYGDHVWGELNPAIAPTVDKDGVVAHRKCTVCGACCDENGKLLSSIVDANRPEANNTVVTIIIVIIAVIVVVAGAVVALRVLKKKKIL